MPLFMCTNKSKKPHYHLPLLSWCSNNLPPAWIGDYKSINTTTGASPQKHPLGMLCGLWCIYGFISININTSSAYWKSNENVRAALYAQKSCLAQDLSVERTNILTLLLYTRQIGSVFPSDALPPFNQEKLLTKQHSRNGNIMFP